MQDKPLDRSTPDRCAVELLEEVVKILRICGQSDLEITEAVAISLRKTPPPGVNLSDVGESAEFHLECCDLVFRWRHDPDYNDENGAPLELPVHGAKPSFESLALTRGITNLDRYARYLEALGAVCITQEGGLKLTSESVLACSGNRRPAIAVHTVLSHILDFVSTVRFNLESSARDGHRRFERACIGRVAPSYIPILQRLIEERGQNFIDGLDEWLNRHSSTEIDGSDSQLVGVGAYLYVRDPVRDF